MRKRRVIIYDDEVIVLKFLKQIFEMRGYETIAFREPMVCPIYEKDHEVCDNLLPCADIIVTDYRMPRMNGVAMLLGQLRRGCKVDIRNKAVISAYIEPDDKAIIQQMQCQFFQKPFDVPDLLKWIDDCETRIDISRPLGDRRREKRLEETSRITVMLEDIRKSYVGFAVNISKSGLCMKTEKQLPKHQPLYVTPDITEKSQRARVRWSAMTDDGYYCSGLSFYLNDNGMNGS